MQTLYCKRIQKKRFPPLVSLGNKPEKLQEGSPMRSSHRNASFEGGGKSGGVGDPNTSQQPLWLRFGTEKKSGVPESWELVPIFHKTRPQETQISLRGTISPPGGNWGFWGGYDAPRQQNKRKNAADRQTVRGQSNLPLFSEVESNNKNPYHQFPPGWGKTNRTNGQGAKQYSTRSKNRGKLIKLIAKGKFLLQWAHPEATLQKGIPSFHLGVNKRSKKKKSRQSRQSHLWKKKKLRKRIWENGPETLKKGVPYKTHGTRGDKNAGSGPADLATRNSFGLGFART